MKKKKRITGAVLILAMMFMIIQPFVITAENIETLEPISRSEADFEIPLPSLPPDVVEDWEELETEIIDEPLGFFDSLPDNWDEKLLELFPADGEHSFPLDEAEESDLGKNQIGEQIGFAYITAESTSEGVDPATRIQAFSTSGTNAVITSRPLLPLYLGRRTNYFDVQTDSGLHLGICAEAHLPTTDGTYPIHIHNSDFIKAIWISSPFVTTTPTASFWNNIGYGASNRRDGQWTVMHLLVSYIYTGIRYDATVGAGAAYAIYVGLHREVQNWLNNNRPALNRYELFISRTNNTIHQDISWIERRPQGTLSLRKVSSHPEFIQGNPNYLLAGAEYGVYRDSAMTQQVANLITNAQGNSNTVTLDAGTYWVRENRPSPGHLIDPNYRDGRQITLTEGTHTIISSVEPIASTPFLFRLRKKDSQGDQAQGDATLEGAEFTVRYYANGAVAGTPTRTWIFATDSDGIIDLGRANDFKVGGDPLYLLSNGNPIFLLGAYSIQETKAPPGYRLPNPAPVHTGRVAMVNGQAEFQWDSGLDVLIVDNEIIIPNDVIRGGIYFEKWDLEHDQNIPLGNATLGGGRYEIINLSQHPVYVDGEWYENGEIVKTIITDEYGVGGTDAYALPYGSYRLVEVLPPHGYLHVGVLYIDFEITRHGVVIEPHMSENVIKNQVIRGDIRGVKIDGGTRGRLAGVPFQITSVTTGESNVVITDQNGEFSTHASWNPHTRNTNRGETSEDGVWFGGGEPDDSLGALPFDNYLVEELRSESNAGFNLIPPIEVTVTRNDHVIDLGTLVNIRPQIWTTAICAETRSKTAFVGETVTIIDFVTFRDLILGQMYLMRGQLMMRIFDEETGEYNEAPLLLGGEPVTAETRFTASKPDGEVQMEFTFNATDLENTTIVVYEWLYEYNEGDEENEGGPGDLVADHTDIMDEGQTVRLVRRDEEPSKPDPGKSDPEQLGRSAGGPQTGDDSSLLLWGSAAVIASVVGTVTLVIKKKKRNRRKTLI